jgi:hypothetical protein
VKRKISTILLLGVSLACLYLYPISAAAAPIAGNGPLGSFTGDFSYDPVTGTITVALTNTSPAANGGYLTSFAINNPDGAITGVTLDSTDPNFALLGIGTLDNTIKASPFGKFDIGASSTKAQLLGGGKPSFGIAPNRSATFTFSVIGGEGLYLQDFLNELSSNPGGGGAQFFIARFRGFADGGSDKVPGTAVPLPPTLILFVTGLVGLVGLGRNLRS